MIKTNSMELADRKKKRKKRNKERKEKERKKKRREKRRQRKKGRKINVDKETTENIKLNKTDKRI